MAFLPFRALLRLNAYAESRQPESFLKIMALPRKLTLADLPAVFERLDSIDRMQRTLGADTNRAHLAAEKGDQYDRRNFVRAFLAGVEGFSSALKTLVLETHEVLGMELTKAEKANILELKLDDGGEAIVCPTCGVKKRFLGLADNVKFAFSMFAKLTATHAPFPAGDPDYAKFLQSIQIRDRLMHPKTYRDLEITDDELRAIGEARRWYLKSSASILIGCVPALDARFATVMKTMSPPV